MPSCQPQMSAFRGAHGAVPFGSRCYGDAVVAEAAGFRSYTTAVVRGARIDAPRTAPAECGISGRVHDVRRTQILRRMGAFREVRYDSAGRELWQVGGLR